ncbi:E3 SUMO-protein ligase MMS21 isoform X1 [Musa acuminata AAA Group]|uniref:E3 SUMO-protein ligase MMS21 isoform X1 n=1 Tax=Musa acuminata AAA Group TaxID=214697 RepID=UPI0031D054A8
MPVSSGSRPQSSTAARISATAATLSSDNQHVIAEIRKALSMMRSIAVDLEKQEQSDKVKELEAAVLELLDTYDDCTHFSEAIQTIGGNYQPSEQLTDFNKLLEDEIAKSKAVSPSVPQNNPFYRQFKEAIWNVHHAGQPMPGEEQEDIIMTSTQNNLLNITCPLTGKPLTELQDPVRCMDCKHIYEKDPILHYIRTKKPHPQCPVAGCPRILQLGRVICDALLPIEIDEMRSVKGVADATAVEDFTEVDDD